MLVKVKKLNDKAIIPTYGSLGAAGADLYAVTEGSATIEPGATVLIGTGIAMEISKIFQKVSADALATGKG